MKIVIDMQGAQTESRFRGVGRYSMSLTMAMVRNARSHEIWLVLNSAFPDSASKIRSEFRGLIPPDRICAFDVPLPVAEYNPADSRCTREAEMIREAFIQSLNPDIVLLTSLFEGFCDDAVTSIGALTEKVCTAVILYDLIPLINPEIYLEIPIKWQYYQRKMESLKRADLLLAISEYSRTEAIDTLGISPEKIVNISAAVDSHFAPEKPAPDVAIHFLKHYGITKPFVLYVPGGSDGRKNFDGLIAAFGMLPAQLKEVHQLVIASRLEDLTRHRLLKAARMSGLPENSLVLTGYVPDEELKMLYALAKLCVFPSTHEGFGLPVLEAMACGVPVIGSSTTSIPEVIGLREALFDPLDPCKIAEKMQEVLDSETFLLRLREHGIQQSSHFSWDKSAIRALQAIEKYTADQSRKPSDPITCQFRRPRLAYFSPLPPARTGIADFSIEILPGLLQQYNIDLITDQTDVSLPTSLQRIQRHSVEWFCEHAGQYDRILYHIGNSPFHSHMLPLLKKYPGTVVLHDFFLGNLMAYEESIGLNPHIWAEALYLSHGYPALYHRYLTQFDNLDEIKNIYPCSLEVIENARGLIVHSECSRQLAKHWFGEKSVRDWHVIPLARAAIMPEKNVGKFEQSRLTGSDDCRQIARNHLKIPMDVFLVCSFGLVDPSKSNNALIDAWLASSLADNPSAMLILVGENHGGEYGRELLKKIQDNKNIKSKIHITGRVDSKLYKNYLLAADMGVQLRSVSRGETSAAVLDCMGSRLPVIINANGSMKEIPTDAVLMLPEMFTLGDLVEALELLWQSPEKRKALGANALNLINTKYHPMQCASQYAAAIEASYDDKNINLPLLCRSLATSTAQRTSDQDLRRISRAVAATLRPKAGMKQLLVDISSIVKNDLKAGIERVVRAELRELIQSPPKGFRVEPVYLKEVKQEYYYQYASEYTCRMLGLNHKVIADAPVDAGQGDIFYGMDFCPYEYIKAAKIGIYNKWRMMGVQISVQIFDLLPVTHPEFFPLGAEKLHEEWLRTVCQTADTLIAISEAVADETRQWISSNVPECQDSPTVYAVPLGADIEASLPTEGLPDDAEKLLESIGGKKCFLMVGTVEPRKGYLQVLAAFDQLWAEGNDDVYLVIVGREGWKQLPDKNRRTIPETVMRLRTHEEAGKRLHWMEGVSDEYLQKIYQACDCLIAASEGEGFGLPLAEAAKAGLPIIARDIPVFREFAGNNVVYFSGLDGLSLANSLRQWLELSQLGKVPPSSSIALRTWREVCSHLASILPDDATEVFESSQAG